MQPDYTNPLATRPDARGEFFRADSIHEVHLAFTDSAWLQVQPQGGPYGINGQGVGWLDLSRFFAETFVNNGDVDNNKRLNRDEFMNMAEKFYVEWSAGEEEMDVDAIDVGYGNSAGGIFLQGEERNGIARVFGTYTPTVTADLLLDNMEFPDVSVRYKGNGTLLGSAGILKKSIKIDLNDAIRGRNVAGLKKLNLHNLHTDAGYVNDALAYKLYNDAGVPGSRTSYAKVYLSVEDSLADEYVGLYLFVENVDNTFAMDRYGTEKGAIFKPVMMKFFEYMGDDWNEYIRSFDPKTPLTVYEQQRIIEVCDFVSNATDEEFALKLGDYFDLDNLARYLAVTVYLTDLDGILGPIQNIYLYLHPGTMKLSFIPWDHDHSFGQMRGSQEEREQLSIMHPWMKDNYFLERAMKVERFTTRYLEVFEELNNSIFKPENLHQQIDHLAAVIRPAVAEESEEQLKKFDFAVGWNVDPELDSAEKMDPRPTRSFVVHRYNSIKDQLAGNSTGLEIGGGYVPRGIMGNNFMQKLDKDSTQTVSREEMIGQFEQWFELWVGPDSVDIDYEELRWGVNQHLSPFGPNPIQKDTTNNLTQ